MAEQIVYQLPEPVPTSVVMMVTPTMAKEWLEVGRTGRKFKEDHDAKILDDIKGGRWRLTGDPVQFDTDGNLIDGLHRLTAIIRANATLPLFVATGLDPGAQLCMDVGAKRTVADQLAISGYSHTAVLSSAGRMALAWSTDGLTRRLDKLSDAAVREFIAANPSLSDAAEFAAKAKSPVRPAAVCAVAWRLIDVGHDKGRVQEFFTSIAEMRSSGPGDPKYALLHRLTTARARRERIKASAIVSMLVRAYNADYLGQSLQKMVVFRSGSKVEIPEIVPPSDQGGEPS